MHIALILVVEQDMVFEQRDADVPQVEVLAHVLEHLGLNPHLWLFQRRHLFEKRPGELLLHYWQALQHRSESDEVQEDLVEGLGEVLLIGAVKYVPVLPEDLAENLLGDVLVLNVVLRVDSDDLGQWLHEVLQRGLLGHVLLVLVVEWL